jgi:hypothetical protein
MKRRSRFPFAVFGDNDEFLLGDDDGAEVLAVHECEFEEGVEVLRIAVYARRC